MLLKRANETRAYAQLEASVARRAANGEAIAQADSRVC